MLAGRWPASVRPISLAGKFARRPDAFAADTDAARQSVKVATATRIATSAADGLATDTSGTNTSTRTFVMQDAALLNCPVACQKSP